MKIVADTTSLVNAIAWATKNYDTRDERASVTLHVEENGTGYLSHGNSNSYLKADFAISAVEFTDEDGDTEANLTLNGSYLRNLSTALSSSKGSATLSKNLSSPKAALNVSTELGKFTVPLFDFKPLPAPKLIELGEVDDNEFFDSLTRIAKLCDAKNFGSASFIGSVDLGFNVEEDRVALFATDRYALSEITLDFTPASKDEDSEAMAVLSKHILLPMASALTVPPTKGLNTSVTLVVQQLPSGATRFGYEFPDGRVALFALTNTDGFRGVEKMKTSAESTIEHSVTIPTSELKNALKVISSLSQDEYDIYLDIDGDSVSITDSQAANSLSIMPEEIEYAEEEAYRAKFSRIVLNAAFSPISTSKIRLKWGSTSKAFILEPVTENGQSVDNIFVMAVLSEVG